VSPIDLQALEALLDLLRRKDVQVFKGDGIEILLGAQATKAAPIVLPPVPTKTERQKYEDILFASSLGFPEEES
jgi:hypothetical protein